MCIHHMGDRRMPSRGSPERMSVCDIATKKQAQIKCTDRQTDRQTGVQYAGEPQKKRRLGRQHVCVGSHEDGM